MVADLRTAVSAADVVVTATNARSPLFDADWVRPGTHITAMGADTAGKQELAPALLDTAELVVCDSVATALHAGELQHASPATQDRAVGWPDLAVRGRPPRSDASITIADLCGIGAEDAAIAIAAVRSLELT